MAFDPAFKRELARIIDAALTEDIGKGDITSQLAIPAATRAEAMFVAREPLVACGLFVIEEIYRRIDKGVKVKLQAKEGQRVDKNAVLANVTGKARALLEGERVALNIMQRMCGVATLTCQYVDAVKGTKAAILDTRKTMPGLRVLDKYAVRAGGGKNHRMRLDDMVLIKDNHIALCGGITEAVRKARVRSKLPIEVECDTLKQVKEALAAKPDRILLDNMNLRQLREAVTLSGGRVKLEASGGVSLATVGAIAKTGVDYISVGKLTHSAPACDIAVDIELT